MKNIFLTLVSLIFIFSSCQEKDFENNVSDQSTNKVTKAGDVVVKKKIENPYSLKNMQFAYSSLKSKNQLKDGEILKPTHLYVRFLPQNTNEYDELKADKSLVLFCYPLDYEITEGESYHDPSLPQDQITWQYTKVPINYTFGPVKYEILEELYMPEETTGDVLKSASTIPWADLLEESMRLTGNLKTESSNETQLKSFLFPSPWTPTALIRVWDDALGRLIPLGGVKVRARHLLHWATAITDANGFASFESFRYGVNYSIVWERANWDIRDGWFIQAYYNGPNSEKSQWNLDIYSGGKSIKYATMHRAAYRHFYGDNLGMLRPLGPAASVQKICYIDAEGTGDYWGNIGGGILPDIRIYGSEGGTDKRTFKVFGTTAHELGHAVQCLNMGNIQFWQVSKIIYESWADAVEWALTKKEYEDLGLYTPLYNSEYEGYCLTSSKQKRWPYMNSRDCYSPIFIDMVDNENQKTLYGGDKPDDNVTGYTMANLSRVALSSYGLSSLKTTLKNNKPVGVTDAQIDLLFKRYEEVWK